GRGRRRGRVIRRRVGIVGGVAGLDAVRFVLAPAIRVLAQILHGAGGRLTLVTGPVLDGHLVAEIILPEHADLRALVAILLRKVRLPGAVVVLAEQPRGDRAVSGRAELVGHFLERGDARALIAALAARQVADRHQVAGALRALNGAADAAGLLFELFQRL